MASKSTKSGAYGMLVAQKDAITRITGIITPESINGLENMLGGAFTKLKSTHFTEGQRYSFLATMIPQEKYRIVIRDATWNYAAPDNPGEYAVAALAPGVAHYLGSQEAGKELLIYGVGDDALAPLKKQYINFGDSTIHSMIIHLREKMAIKMTTSQKFKYKAEGYGKQWDPTTSITAYFMALDKFRTSLANRGISTSVDEMTMAAGARMWESEMFTEDQMVAWENKTAAQQTWQALQDYFTEKWLERRQYSQATAKHSRFKDAALAAQETAAAEEEGKASAMMFALLQEQHKAQLDAMTSANQKAMDAMFERKNAIIAGNGPERPDKENTPPGGNVNPGNDTGTMKRKKKKRPHCGKMVFHKAAECYELEANASKRWTGWKSAKETGETTK